MTDMRVLVVTTWFPCAAAPGSGLFNLRDAQLLAQDHEVDVLHLIRPEWGSGEQEDPSGLRVERVPFSLQRPATMRTAARRIRERAADFDLVHSMAFSALPPMWRAGIDVPWVHTEHFSQLVTPSVSKPMALINGAIKRLFAHPAETVAVSRALAKVIDRYRTQPTTVIGNAVMVPVDSLSERRDISEGLHLIGVGGLVARKGPTVAVETLAELVKRGQPARLTWVGEGPLQPEVISAAKRLGVADRVELTGHLHPERLSHALRRADMFLLPVETETFGVAIAEALAHGLPVVASGSGGHEEFLPSEASRLVAAREAGPLADAVEDLIGDPELWSRARIADYARDRFSDGVRRDAYLAVYTRAAEEHSG